MSRWQDQPRNRHESVTIRTIWLTLALSILIHTAALFVLIPHLKTVSDELAPSEASAPVQVRLSPPPSAPAPSAPEPSREATATIAPPPRPPKVAARPPPRQAMIAPNTPAPEVVVPPPPPPPPPPSPPVAATPPVPAPAGDLASFIASRRLARGETAGSSVDEERERYNRTIAANLPTGATGTAGRAPKHGGGIFAIKRMAYDDAVFEFYGWNKEVGQRTPQSFEVRKGNNPDMRIAVVRRMIAIIREYEKEDFVWESHRLGRSVTLSARLADNAGLEEFLMHEFSDEFANTH